MRSGNRPEDEQRQPRDVQRSMERYAALGRDRRRIAQRVQRLSDGCFFGERQEGGPHDRNDRDDQTRDAECRFGRHQSTSRRTYRSCSRHMRERVRPAPSG